MSSSGVGDDYDGLYKIILVGDPDVGKTHLLARYTRNQLPKTPAATVGVEFATHTVPLATGGTIKAQIWDTAGQERYRSITSAHFRRAAGALIVFSLANRQSFLNASKWLADVITHAGRHVILMLVGNKCDLVDSREVSTAEAEAWAKKNGLMYIETSATLPHNLRALFERVLQEVYSRDHRGSLSSGGGDTKALRIGAQPASRVFTLDDVLESPESSNPCCKIAD